MLTSTIYFDKIIITKNIDKEMYVKMKSRKFKAVLAAVSAIAVLATAMTGFAANISTVTKYNLADATKASVTTTVEGLTKKDAEVTLLVSAPGAGVNGSGISYIDQKAASDGTAVFTYQLDKAALSDATAATVITGNDAQEDVDGNNAKLDVVPLTSQSGDHYTVNYGDTTHIGKGDTTLIVNIVVDDGYELETVTIDGTEQTEVKATYSVNVSNGVQPTVVAKTKAKQTTVDIAASGLVIDNKSDTKSAITVIKVTGETTGYEIGVNYKGYTFPAAGTVKNGFIAVQLTNNKDFVEGDISVYCTPKTSAEK